MCKLYESALRAAIIQVSIQNKDAEKHNNNSRRTLSVINTNSTHLFYQNQTHNSKHICEKNITCDIVKTSNEQIQAIHFTQIRISFIHKDVAKPNSITSDITKRKHTHPHNSTHLTSQANPLPKQIVIIRVMQGCYCILNQMFFVNGCTSDCSVCQ